MQTSPPETEVRREADIRQPWHALEAASIEQQLDTSLEVGLTSEEAQARLEVYGPNELEEAPRPSFLQMVLRQFSDFIVLILIAAALISGVLGDYEEAAAILAIVILNAILGVIQERRAEEALAALRKMAAPEAHVLRDGHRRSVPARELVPGDLVLLEAGNYVPADIRLTDSHNLRIEEAALTGESVPVEKDASRVHAEDASLGDRTNAAFSGTLVAFGRGRGVVVTTGMNTQIGVIASMIQSVQSEETPLQRRLDNLGRTLGAAALIVCGLVFLVGILQGFEALEMFIVAVSLAVAAVPEGLPAVVTITLALGMREMVKRNALIRRLSSVESLGSTTVICADKTGTLTQNRMTVRRIWVDGHELHLTGPGNSAEGAFERDGQPVDLAEFPAVTTALWVAALDNDAVLESEDDQNGKYFRLVGDPTEAALVVAAAKAGAWRDALEQSYPRINEFPFDSARKRMTTIHKVANPMAQDPSPFYDREHEEWEVAATKGAPDVVLELCSHYQTIDDERKPLTAELRERILSANEAMARQALRVLAVAYRLERDVPDEQAADAVERDLTFVGLIGMIDPPREEVGAAIEEARQAGLRTVMITGDYPDTARAIAEQIGLLQAGHQVVTGKQLSELNKDELRRKVREIDVFARVSPEHKVDIVDALKAEGEIVAMTGDGVNDAPALKRADIGVAMGISGTDVAKETADMVLTDDNYVSIVSAVEQGRIIYSNIRKFVYYLLSCNTAEITVIFTAIVAGLPSPLTAIQLLWLNLVTDGAPALALGLESGDPDIMEQPPRPPDEPIINRLMRTGIAVQTLAIAGATLTAYILGRSLFGPGTGVPSTMAFATLSFSELLRAFTARSERYSLLRLGVFSNRYMILAVITSTVLLLTVIYVPFLQPYFDTVSLNLDHWQIILPLLFIPAITAELMKWLVLPRRFKRAGAAA